MPKQPPDRRPRLPRARGARRAPRPGEIYWSDERGQALRITLIDTKQKKVYAQIREGYFGRYPQADYDVSEILHEFVYWKTQMP